MRCVYETAPEQISKIGKCDMLLIPVGGFFTVDGDGAAQVAQMLGGGTLVPMHYRIGSYGFPKISGLEPFLAHFAPEQVHRLSENSFTAEKAVDTQVVIPALPF